MGICRGWRSPLFFSLLPLALFLPLILSVSKLHRSNPIPQVSKRSRHQ
ncbi:unnamed protein product [Musa acuminata subsp. malaccensis]|uniref:(wild Malaysian banana) hypothetical protein n=1 Tax=Musa acuminata subsp. malaccensis TaxID=214687 RepID=A0A804KYM2_MUSAM|nr:unnamed protein product [Musa acuminata subsp. malaccensis]